MAQTRIYLDVYYTAKNVEKILSFSQKIEDFFSQNENFLLKGEALKDRGFGTLLWNAKRG